LFKWLSCITLAFGHRINDLPLKIKLTITSTSRDLEILSKLACEQPQTSLYSLFTVAIDEPAVPVTSAKGESGLSQNTHKIGLCAERESSFHG
jgi:hypothetical protein